MIVWSVVIMISILVIVVSWYIYYILRMSFKEMKDDTTEQEKLLQLQSNGD